MMGLGEGERELAAEASAMERLDAYFFVVRVS